MTVIKRLARSGALVALVSVAGASSAAAWTSATTSSPMKVYSAGTLAGQGAGSLTFYAWNQAKLNTQLTDNKSNGYRTFIDVKGSAKIGTVTYYSSAQTGRRADGESWWATMATKDVKGSYISSHYLTVKTCGDNPWSPDACSAVKNGYLSS